MKRQLGALNLEQFHLPMHTARKAGEAAAGANDTMARDEYGNGIGPASAAHRAGRLGAANGAGEFAVAARAAKRNTQECTPDLLLECSAR